MASWIELEILIPKHPWKSKIGLLQPILAAKRYVTFFLGHPVSAGRCSADPILSLMEWHPNILLWAQRLFSRIPNSQRQRAPKISVFGGGGAGVTEDW